MTDAKRKVVIAGGAGFLGRTLAHWYSQRNWEVIVISRSTFSQPGVRSLEWDGKTLGRWASALEGAAAVINLAGRSVNCRYTPSRRQEIIRSRVDSTRVLGEAIAACVSPPEVWLNSSTATIYKHTHDRRHGESGETGATPEAKDEFSIEVARRWEEAFARAETPHTRKVVLRTAVVLGNEPGGAYDVFRRLVRFGLGGTIGTGRQYFSWIHAADFCRAIDWIIDRGSSGIYNLAAPNPETNREMMSILRSILHVPFGLPAFGPILEFGAWLMRTETELVIKSRSVVPERLIAEGFNFQHDTLDNAVRSLEDSRR